MIIRCISVKNSKKIFRRALLRKILFFIWQNWVESPQFCQKKVNCRYHNLNKFNYSIELLSFPPPLEDQIEYYLLLDYFLTVIFLHYNYVYEVLKYLLSSLFYFLAIIIWYSILLTLLDMGGGWNSPPPKKCSKCSILML